AQTPGPGRIHRAVDDRHAGDGRSDLFQHFQPFPRQRGLGAGKSSGVAAWARQTRNDAYTYRIRNVREHDRYGGGRFAHDQHDLAWRGQNGVRCAIDEVFNLAADAIGIRTSHSIFDLDIAAFRPSQLLQLLPECVHAGLGLHIAPSIAHQHADPAHALALLRARRERPRRSRAAEKRDEIATFHHSITSSASASNWSGILRPSVLAVFMLSTKSYLVGCMTGRLTGLSPLRTRPT